jgi:fatty acid desaturase
MTSETSHPHDLVAGRVLVRIPTDELRALSRLSPARALGAIASEWLAIAGAIALAVSVAHPLVTVAAILFIGARQHALLVIAHDASHYRLLPHRRANDWVGNLLLSWPMFVSVQGFRHFHGSHHRFLNAAGDGNRALWKTHGRDDALAPEWRYPKSGAALVMKLLRRGAVLTGLWWMIRGIIGGFAYGMTTSERIVRALWLSGVAATLTWAHAWPGFLWYWVVPYCTWHVLIQYARLICEHSNVDADGSWAATRTTVPRLWERLFILPRNIGFHIEHHWYPSVPFYRLDELHARLMKDEEFRANANISRSVLGSLAEVTRAR